MEWQAGSPEGLSFVIPYPNVSRRPVDSPWITPPLPSDSNRLHKPDDSLPIEAVHCSARHPRWLAFEDP